MFETEVIDGVKHMNAKTSGCPFCGAKKQVTYGDKHPLVFHYPGTMCCSPRIEQMMHGLKNEMYQAEAPLRKVHTEIQEMQQKLPFLTGAEKQQAEAYVAKQNARLPKLEAKVRERLQDLATELQEYKAALKELQNA